MQISKLLSNMHETLENAGGQHYADILSENLQIWGIPFDNYRIGGRGKILIKNIDRFKNVGVFYCFKKRFL
jgi:hypothetical protein